MAGEFPVPRAHIAVCAGWCIRSSVWSRDLGAARIRGWLRLAVVLAVLLAALGGAAPASADTVTKVTGTSVLEGVACGSATNCWATGNSGGQATGAVVPITSGVPGTVYQVSGANDLHAIACPTATSCLAVGTGNFASYGAIVQISNGHPGPATTLSGTAYLRGVACSTSTFCVAVGWQTGNYNGANARIGVVVPIDNGSPGAVELISGTLDVDGVACPTTSSCVAVGTAPTGPGQSAGVIVPISGGTAGSPATVPATSELLGVACASAADCVAVGPIPGGNGSGAVVPIDNGAAGAAMPVPGGAGVWGVACASTTQCWAVGNGAGGGADGGIVPVSIGSAPGAFTPEAGTSRLYGVGCMDGNCVAAGQAPPLGSGPGVVASFGGAEGPMKYLDVAKAKADMPAALQSAVYYCTPTALGLYGFGTGILLIGNASALAVAGAITAYATAPFCVATIKRVVNDYHRIKDPPDSNIHQLANPAPIGPVKLPSCKRWHRNQRAFCTQLSTPERKWARAAEQIASIDQALATTQARERAAITAGDQTAVNLQDGHIPALEQQEHTALSAKATAGKAIAHVLRTHHLGYRKTKAQATTTISAIKRKLAKQGITSSELKQYAANALRPHAVNLLAALGQR